MKKLTKLFSVVLCSVMTFALAACNKNNNNNNQQAECSMTLEQMNKLLNDKVHMDMDNANHVEVIPFHHVNGPKEEWDFYALVNFEADMQTYVRYQVTYLSCTCRSAEVNYWSTAYVELTKPGSGEANDIALQKLSFDVDGTGNYTAGFWGDSSPITTDGTHPTLDGTYHDNIIATYDRYQYTKSDTTTGYYSSIKYDFIPHLIGLTKAQFDEMGNNPQQVYSSTVVDLTVADLVYKQYITQDVMDAFTGASVSTNNILRIIRAMMSYHADRYM